MRADGYYALPAENVVLHDATLEKGSQDGMFIKRSKDELNYPDNPLFARKQDGQDIPVYEVNSAGKFGLRPVDNYKPVMPEAHLMKTAEGHEYILVNEAYQKRSPEEMQEKKMTDYTVEAMQKSGYYKNADLFEAGLKNDPAALKKFQDFKNYVADETAVTGQQDVTFIVADSKKLNDMGLKGVVDEHTAFALTTQENHKYMVVSSKLMNSALQSEEKMTGLKGAVGHELTHFENGDGSLEGSARGYNNIAIARYEEMQGDLKGAVRAHNTEGLIQLFESELKKVAPVYQAAPENQSASRQLSSVENPSAADFTKLSDELVKAGIAPEHPAMKDRIEAQKLVQAEMREYEKTHTVRTAADREEEAKVVVPKVMKTMESKWQLPMQAPDAPAKSQEVKPEEQKKDHASAKPHGLNDSQMKDVMTMRNSVAHMGSLKIENTETATKDHSAPAKQQSQDGVAIRA